MYKSIFATLTISLSLTIIATSCTKSEDEDPTGNYTCHCSVTNSSGTTTFDQPLNGVSRSHATNACAELQDTNTGAGSAATCAIK